MYLYVHLYTHMYTNMALPFAHCFTTYFYPYMSWMTSHVSISKSTLCFIKPALYSKVWVYCNHIYCSPIER